MFTSKCIPKANSQKPAAKFGKIAYIARQSLKYNPNPNKVPQDPKQCPIDKDHTDSQTTPGTFEIQEEQKVLATFELQGEQRQLR
jgi:hypothetical protein